MKNSKIPIDEIITAGGEIISNEPPKTFMGKVLRFIKKLIFIKDSSGIKINKQ